MEDQDSNEKVDKNFLWGEIPGKPPTITLTAAEKEALLRIPRPIQLRGPKLYQPGAGAAPKEEPDEKDQGKQQESVLMQCARLQEALRNPNDAPGEDLPLNPIKLARAGPFDTRYSFDDDSDDDNDEAKMNRVPPSTLTPTAAGKQLRRSVAEVLAAVGFATCSSMAMDVVVDTTAEVFRRLCVRLKEAKEAGSGGGYSDCLDRALAETGTESYT